MPPKRPTRERPAHRHSGDQLEAGQSVTLDFESPSRILATLPDELPTFSPPDDSSDEDEWPSMIGVKFSTPVRAFSRRQELTPNRMLRHGRFSEDEKVSGDSSHELNFIDSGFTAKAEEKKQNLESPAVESEPKVETTVQVIEDGGPAVGRRAPAKNGAKGRPKKRIAKAGDAADQPGPSRLRIDTLAPTKLKPRKRVAQQLDQIDEAGDSALPEVVESKRKKKSVVQRSPYPLRARQKKQAGLE